MKPLMLAGVVVTALGIIALVLGGDFVYKSRETFPRDADTQIIAKQEKVVSVPPLMAGLAVAGGFAMMLVAARK